MTFVNLSLLAGAAFIAVPIVLHLIMRQQPRQLEFPALRFLKLRRESNTRRLRLRHLLLLLLRVGAICLLALALARPSLRGSSALAGQESPVAAVLIFDTSPRMEYRHQNQTRLEVAQQMGLWLLKQLPRESEIAVMDAHVGLPAFAVDAGAAQQRLERLRPTPVAQPLPTLLQNALELLKPVEHLPREIYIFTDLAQSAWQTPNAERLRAQLAELEEVGLYLIDVGVESPRDFALGETRLSRQLLAAESELTVSTVLGRLGPGERRTVELFLLDELGQPRKRGQQSVEVSEDSAAALEFRLSALDPGTHQGYLRLAGEDALKWDDIRFFTVEVRPAWQVLVAADEPANAVFFSEAISPAAFRESGQARFEVTVIDTDNLAEQRFTEYAAVCLLDPGPLAEQVWDRLAEYVQDGGAVALFLGRNAQLDAFNDPAAQALLPGKLVRQWRATTYLAPNDLQHPLLANFRQVEQVPWSAFPVFRYWQLDDFAPGVNTILPYANGVPAVLERPLGAGRVLTMTTPVSDPANVRGQPPWNVLPTGSEPWPFVMLSNEMLLYLVGSGQDQLNYLAGDTAVLRTDPSLRTGTVALTLPDGQLIRQTVDPEQNSIVVTATDTPGNYRLQAGGTVGGLDRGFSVNLPPSVSQLQRVAPEELKELLGEDRFRIARRRDQIERVQGLGRVGEELFPYLIMATALILGLEQVLANRFYRRR